MGSKLLALHCGRQSKRGDAHKVAAPQHKADPREGLVAGGWLPSTGSCQRFTAGHFPPVPSPAASVLQQLVFYSRALGTEVNKESPSCRASTQLAQIIVMGPLHIAPPLNLKERRNASQFRTGLHRELLSNSQPPFSCL